MTEQLSPAARAVVDAFNSVPLSLDLSDTYRRALAAALRAAADQVVPKDDDPSNEWTTKDEIRYNFLALAAELEQSN